MIRRLRIRGYKSLANCQVEFAPLSVIFGANGAGKSNLLDLLGLMSRLASRETVREAFEGHRGRPLEAFHSDIGFGQKAYNTLLEKDRVSFAVECDLELHPRIVTEVNATLKDREKVVGATVPYTRVSEARLRYSIEIALHPKSGELLVANESLCALKKDLQPRSAVVRHPFFERQVSRGEKPRFVARVERQGHPRFFETDRPRTLLSELSDPVYHPHVVAAAREIASWRIYYVEPARMREEVGVQAAEEPGRSGELLAAYYYYLQEKHPQVLKGIARNLQDVVMGLDGLRVDVRKGLLEIITTRTGGSEYPARLLSEGTLRLLCVLGIAVAPSPPAVVGYEEPENGVNPARLELISRILRNAVEVRSDGPQFILTTHSPLVCSVLPNHLIKCTWVRGEGTKFSVFPWTQDSLFFADEIVRALESESSAARDKSLPGVALREGGE